MPVVFLHPVGLDGDCWGLTGLEGEFFTYPGHGNRPMPSEGFTLESIADEVGTKYDDPLDLVGVSMGVAVSLYTAVRHPGHVRSMLLANGSAGRSIAPEATVDAVQNARAEETLRLGMAGTLNSTLERWFTRAALDAPGHPGVAYVRHRWLANDPNAIAATWLALGKNAVVDEVSRIRVPVTVLTGRDDASNPDPVAAGRKLCSRLPHGRQVVLDGPHMLHLERPAEFAAAVRDHLNWVTSFETDAGLPHRQV